MRFMKSPFYIMAAMVVMSALVLSTQAQTTTSVQGTATVGYSGASGDPTNGGQASGSGTIGYTGNDPVKTQGGAAAAGAGASQQTIGSTSVKSSASSVLSTLSNVTGAQTGMTQNGAATSASWAGLGDSTNYVSGGSNATGTYSGTDAAQTSLQGSGAAKGKTETTGTLTGVGTSDVSTTTHVVGSSAGQLAFQTPDSAAKPTVSSGVSGMGVLSSQGVAGDPTGKSSFAGGTVAGQYGYTAANPTGAQTIGQGAICSATNAKVTNPGVVSASASVTSSSSTQVKP